MDTRIEKKFWINRSIIQIDNRVNDSYIDYEQINLGFIDIK